MTYSESLRSVVSRHHPDWGLQQPRRADALELRRLRDVRAAAQAKTLEEFLRTRRVITWERFAPGKRASRRAGGRGANTGGNPKA